MLPSASTREQVIFDGTNEQLSFDTFIHQLASSENWIDTTGFAFTEHAEDIVPSFLFGAALRYYETLDSDCQHEWSLLRDAMAGRFPGGIRSGGTIQRSVMQWDEDGLKTPAQAPPITAATPMGPISVPTKKVLYMRLEHRVSTTHWSVQYHSFITDLLYLVVYAEKQTSPTLIHFKSQPSEPSQGTEPILIASRKDFA
ncbi:hypothetical protein FRC00_011658 [Tulasnella sp. 408]|nr:hypothetical protein FRC00_011658 [Tulasnella sp. 408]